MTDNVILIDKLTKKFGNFTALDSITAEVARGDTVGLLGLNGAGKTTLLETILGFAIPDGGSVTVFGGSSSVLASESTKHRIGFVPQQDELLANMTGRKFLDLLARFYPSWNDTFVARLATEWHVPLDKPANRLSVGQRQKLSILSALGHEPELIVLDEPVASLDPVARRAFLKELVDLVADRSRTILFSTHIVTDLERVADRVWVLKEGRLVVDQPLDDLKDSAQEADSRGAPVSDAQTDRSLEEMFLELHR